MSEIEINDQLRRGLVSAWHEFLQALDPIRPDLHRYCRRLSGNVWDAEDLVQETLLRAFSHLSQVLHSINNPRAYILRVASNLWIDTVRRRASEAAALTVEASDPLNVASAGASPAQAIEVREAGARLMSSLAPQERAVVVLKDVFDMSIEETASILSTTPGAVKAALHRGRNRLRDFTEQAPRCTPPSAGLLDRFVDRYNARDLPGLLALMSDTASIDMYGLETETGRAAFERQRGWFHHNFYNPFDGSPSTLRWQAAVFQDEPIVLVFDGVDDALVSVMRIEEQDAAVQRIRVYALCPDTVSELGAALGYSVRTFGYRFPFDVGAQP
jgi:RNA polymerase sigma-70 factor (ECF subfamily)